MNAMAVYALHPDLAAALLAFNMYLLLGSTLRDRDRELLILRTSWLRDSEYELVRHAHNAKRVGISDEELARIPIGSTAPGWDLLDALLLRAVEELCSEYRIANATWIQLEKHYTQQQLMDIAFTVGAYDMLAMAFNTIGVEPEAGIPPFPTGG
jgi:alkylhydroperoxidase family enzyme